MFRIGDFSKLSLVPVSALRYYDEMGLFKPGHVDATTGYRYYSANQLARLNKLLALKDMGLSLDQIAKLLDDNLTPEQIRGMLKIKQVELAEQIKNDQMRLGRIEAWLQQFEQENAMSDYAVIVKKVPALRVAQMRVVAPTMAEIGVVLSGGFRQLEATIEAQGAKYQYPGITIYYNEEMSDKNIEMGASLYFEGNLAESDRVKVVELPSADEMASVIHHGTFATLSQAYEAIMQWIERNGYKINSYSRELNIAYDPQGDPAKYVTEIQFPVTKA